MNQKEVNYVVKTIFRDIRKTMTEKHHLSLGKQVICRDDLNSLEIKFLKNPSLIIKEEHGKNKKN